MASPSSYSHQATPRRHDSIMRSHMSELHAKVQSIPTTPKLKRFKVPSSDYRDYISPSTMQQKYSYTPTKEKLLHRYPSSSSSISSSSTSSFSSPPFSSFNDPQPSGLEKCMSTTGVCGSDHSHINQLDEDMHFFSVQEFCDFDDDEEEESYSGPQTAPGGSYHTAQREVPYISPVNLQHSAATSAKHPALLQAGEKPTLASSQLRPVSQSSIDQATLHLPEHRSVVGTLKSLPPVTSHGGHSHTARRRGDGMKTLKPSRDLFDPVTSTVALSATRGMVSTPCSSCEGSFCEGSAVVGTSLNSVEPPAKRPCLQSGDSSSSQHHHGQVPWFSSSTSQPSQR